MAEFNKVGKTETANFGGQVVKKSTSANYIFLLMLAIPYLLPPGLASLPIYSLVSKMKYLSILCVLLIAVKHGRFKINRFHLSIIGFGFALVGITFVKDSDSVSAIKAVMDMLFALMWSGKMLEYSEKKTLKLLTYYYSLLAIMNLVLIIRFPDGIVETPSVNAMNLMGDKNKMVFTLICGLGISLYYAQKFSPIKTAKKYSVLFIIIFTSSLVKTWAATGIVATLLMLLMFYFDNHVEVAKKIFTIRNIVVVVGIAFYLVVFTKFFQQGIFAEFMVNVLHKNANFSSRTTLWTQAIAKIWSSPIWGYGYGTDSVYDFSFSGAQGILSGFSCHNGFLRILLEGGIVLLLLYMNIYLTLYKSIKTFGTENTYIRVLVFSMAGFLVACLFEAEYTGFLYLVMLEIINFSKRSEIVRYESKTFIY